MAKSPRKPAPKTPSVTAKSSPATSLGEALSAIPEMFRNRMLQSGILFAFAFAIYANTLTHEFTQDDMIVITDNMFTKQGAAGIPGILSKDTFFGFFKVEGKETLVSGGRYRPFTLVLFALMYQAFGENSFMFHLLTVSLFAVSCVVLYHTLLLLLAPQRGDNYAAMLAWISAILFAAHPIHTEAVANIKGCDEIVALLASLGALYATLRAFDSGKIVWTIASFLLFFIACMSKENAVTYVVVAPLALAFFRNSDRGWGKIIGHSAPLWTAFLLFFVIRGNILDWRFGGQSTYELMNNPFLKIQNNLWVPFSSSEKAATIIFTLGKYLQLLIVPITLTSDYYPREVDMMTFASPKVWLSLLVYGFLTVYALRGIRHRDPVRFGILYFLLTVSIVSNVVFPVGTNMSERFIFMPSVGFCLALGALMLSYIRRPQSVQTVLGITLVLAGLFGARTFVRNFAWESNEKLFLTDVKNSPNSAKINNAAGGTLFDKAMKEKEGAERDKLLREAMGHFNKAVQIYPNYRDAIMSVGACQYYLKNYDAAIEQYRAALRVSTDDAKAKSGLATCLRDAGKYHGEQKGDVKKAVQLLNEAWQLNNTDAETARLLGVANGVQEKRADALQWFQKAVELDPKNASTTYDLGTAYYLMGDAVKGEEYRRKAAEIDPKILEQKTPR